MSGTHASRPFGRFPILHLKPEERPIVYLWSDFRFPRDRKDCCERITRPPPGRRQDHNRAPTAIFPPPRFSPLIGRCGRRTANSEQWPESVASAARRSLGDVG